MAALCPADRDGKGLSGVSDNGVPQDLMLDHAFPIKNCMGYPLTLMVSLHFWSNPFKLTGFVLADMV